MRIGSGTSSAVSKDPDAQTCPPSWPPEGQIEPGIRVPWHSPKHDQGPADELLQLEPKFDRQFELHQRLPHQARSLDDVDVAYDLEEKEKHLNRIYLFSKRLAPAHNSFEIYHTFKPPGACAWNTSPPTGRRQSSPCEKPSNRS